MTTTSARTMAGGRLGVRLRSQWDRSLVWLLAGASLVVMLSGHQQLARSTSNTEQVAFLISAGFGGLFLLCIGITLLLVAELRDTDHKLDRIDLALRGEPLAAPRQVLALEPGRSPSGCEAAARATGTRSWLSRPVLVCTACWLLGGALVTGGWLTAAGTGSVARAMDGLALAAAGLTLAVAGLVNLALGLGTGRARRLRNFSAAFVDFESSAAIDQDAGPGDSGECWSAAGLRRFHRRFCVALVHAEGTPHRVDVTTSDLEPCLICHHESEGVSRHE